MDDKLGSLIAWSWRAWRAYAGHAQRQVIRLRHESLKGHAQTRAATMGARAAVAVASIGAVAPDVLASLAVVEVGQIVYVQVAEVIQLSAGAARCGWLWHGWSRTRFISLR
eukprot:COSAG05_NODE_2648_length_2806_cov_2.556335_3_plen_111_part_00